MIDDVLTNKIAIIRRCLGRIAEEFRDDPSRLEDFTAQDSIVLNLLRACEASIDLAMHRVSLEKLGVPQSSRDAFDLLDRGSILRTATSTAMKHMVGFRNIAVHSDENLQLPILESIVTRNLTDFETFISEITHPHPQS